MGPAMLFRNFYRCATCGCAAFAEDHRLVALETDHNSQIVPLVRCIVVNGAILVEPLDIDDVDLAGLRVDDVALRRIAATIAAARSRGLSVGGDDDGPASQSI